MVKQRFDAFIQSLIAPGSSKKDKSKPKKDKRVAEPKFEPKEVGDADLLQLLTAGTEHAPQQSGKTEEDRIRGVGLGFERTGNASDRNMVEEIAKMKKKALANNGRNIAEEKEKKKAIPRLSLTSGFKSGIDKKKNQGFKERMLDERKAKVEQRKAAKLLKEQEAAKPKEEVVPQAEPIEEKNLDSAERPEKVHFKKNQLKKTRSKQKNKKKDTRPLEERRAKLALKGITI